MLPVKELISRWSTYILVTLLAILAGVVPWVFTKPIDLDKMPNVSDVVDEARKEALDKNPDIIESRRQSKEISEFMQEQHNDFKDTINEFRECVEGWKECDKSLKKLSGIVAKLDKKKYPGLALDVMILGLIDGGLPDEKESRKKK